MTKSTLELEIDEVRERLKELHRRVRIDDAARRFIQLDHEVRSGDYVKFSDGYGVRVSIDDFDERWTYTDRNGHTIEHGRIPPEDGIERLYTLAEVEEIIAKLSFEALIGADVFEHGQWRSCTGCHELNEGHATGPWSTAFRCNVGNGCHECGGIGAIWEEFKVGSGG